MSGLLVILPIAFVVWGVVGYTFGWWWRGYAAPRRTCAVKHSREMTPEELKHFEAAFAKMDEAFREMDKVFRA